MCHLLPVENTGFFTLQSRFSSYVAEAKGLTEFHTGQQHTVIGVWASDPARRVYNF